MSNPPKHIAIVMDGNGRWAKQRKLPRASGHRAGAKAVRRAIEFAANQGVEVLTLFALSIENRERRPKTEVQLLMRLFLESLESNTPELSDNNIRMVIVGDHTHFSERLQAQIQRSMELTANNTGMTLVIAINYSGRWDITQATQRVAAQVASGDLLPGDVTEASVSAQLSLSDFPDPDLFIRTSGEQRISNFLLWQCAYSELFFTPVFWPDFDATTFQAALDFYATRQRRFGQTGEQLERTHA